MGNLRWGPVAAATPADGLLGAPLQRRHQGVQGPVGNAHEICGLLGGRERSGAQHGAQHLLGEHAEPPRLHHWLPRAGFGRPAQRDLKGLAAEPWAAQELVAVQCNHVVQGRVQQRVRRREHLAAGTGGELGGCDPNHRDAGRC